MIEPSFGAVLARHGAGARADEIAIRYGEDAVSWRELDRRTDARAAQLIAAGVRPNDLVAIALFNGVAHHEWTFAAWKAGATPCVLPGKLPGNELQEIVRLANPRVLVRSGGQPIDGVAEIAADAPLPDRDDPPPPISPRATGRRSPAADRPAGPS